MKTVTYNDKSYEIDEGGFLLNFNQWDENFAEGMAREAKLSSGLSDKHWRVLRFIRDYFNRTGKCPVVYETCKMNGLTVRSLKELFPNGYLRGACKLAGLSYKDRLINYYGEEGRGIWAAQAGASREEWEKISQKVYRVDVNGFLVDPNEWDENFARNLAYTMKLGEDLTEMHWKIIYFIRNSFKKNDIIPTIFETCDANQLELYELEKLFPDGYHRCAVRLAGLRFR